MSTTGGYHTNVIAHSYGGLVARLYAWDHPSRVDKLILIGVPNGGLELADAVCLFKNANGPWAGLLWGAELFDDQIGDCKGPQDALYQLQTDYVRNVFNVQVPDRDGTQYSTITGLLPDEGRLFDLFPGADDGMVTLDSSEYLWRGRVDHPGKHLTLAQLPLEHGQLIVPAGGSGSIDADGTDDELRVHGSVTVEVGGTYAVNARLLAPDRTEIAEFQTAAPLTAGANTFTLVFDGDAIAAASMDGPYLVEDLSVYPTSDADVLGYLSSAHRTAGYSAGQFSDTPPLAEITSSSARFYPPPPCDPCTQAIAEGTVLLSATGVVSASSGTVSAYYRLWGIPINGTPVLVADWAPASPTDGAFDSGSESITVNDSRDNAGYTAYDLDVRATAGGQSATATVRVPIKYDTTAPISNVDLLPASTNSSPITIIARASDNWGPTMIVRTDLWYRYRKLTNNPWGIWSNWLADTTPPYAFTFPFPDGKGYYEFYSIATDQSGNVEAPPAVADAKIQKK